MNSKIILAITLILLPLSGFSKEWKNKFDATKPLPKEGSAEIRRGSKTIQFKNLAAADKELRDGDELILGKGYHRPPVEPGKYSHGSIPSWFHNDDITKKTPAHWIKWNAKVDTTPTWNIKPESLTITGQGIDTIVILPDSEGTDEKPAQWIFRTANSYVVKNLRLVNIRFVHQQFTHLFEDVVFDFKIEMPWMVDETDFKKNLLVCLYCVNWTPQVFKNESHKVLWIGSIQFISNEEGFEPASKFDAAFSELDSFSASLEVARAQGTLAKGDKKKAALALKEIAAANPNDWKQGVTSKDTYADVFKDNKYPEFDFSASRVTWLKDIRNYLKSRY